MDTNDDNNSVHSFDAEPQTVLNLNMETQAIQIGRGDSLLGETPPPSSSTINNATPTKQPVRRGPKAQGYVSPLKQLKRKSSVGQKIATYVFFDLETTGLFPKESNWKDDRISDPNAASSNLGRYIVETSLDAYPRITEMSFVAVPRPIFEVGVKKMEEQEKAIPAFSSLRQRISANSYTAQVNPRLSEVQWAEYENQRKFGKINALTMTRFELQCKADFASEWKTARLFLENLPKPACFVAHNGIRFDFRVLYGELHRAGLEHTIPDGFVFIDSYNAFREIDLTHQRELQQVIGLVDWQTISEHLTLTRAQITVEEKNVMERDMFDDTCRPDFTLPRNQGERTPERPIPSRGTASEPPKLSTRRALFTREQPLLPLREDHPLLYLNTDKWSPAKKKRIQHQFFVREVSGAWAFDNISAGNHLRQRGTYSLGAIHKKMMNVDFEAHHAQDDCEALLQVAMSYGMDFINYVDKMGADFPF